MSAEEQVHFWSATPATFRAVRAAAKADGVTLAEWVGQAVKDRLSVARGVRDGQDVAAPQRPNSLAGEGGPSLFPERRPSRPSSADLSAFIDAFDEEGKPVPLVLCQTCGGTRRVLAQVPLGLAEHCRPWDTCPDCFAR